ncbi:hypothetical protein RJ639_045488 [Escallonia herrerae]|uniref:GH3 middle domain-containing protein n=1 Tax=Escallonia herrerae TaxID=1293975 RepID=A0AA89AXR2_9ASTE|nr:hypothetical protein RJ639_045488 [Escallonia herrerae]
MYFFLATLKIAYVLTIPKPIVDEAADEAIKQTAMKQKQRWEDDDTYCKGYILGGLSDTLYDLYEIKYANSTAKELWDDLDSKYKTEDAGNKKFLITWKECRKELKQKKDAMTMQELVKYIQVEENSRNLDRLELEENKSSKALVIDHASSSGTKHKLDGQASASTNRQDKPKKACWKNRKSEDTVDEDKVNPTPEMGEGGELRRSKRARIEKTYGPDFYQFLVEGSRNEVSMLLTCDPTDTEGGLKLLEDLTINANLVQQQVLEKILTQNATTRYLRSFLNGQSPPDKTQFKKKVPIVDYEEVKPYIERIANGEPSDIISAQNITELLTSSGTSAGQPKMMPSTAEDLDRKTFFYNILVPVMNKYVDGLDQGKGMYLLFIKPEIATPAGLVARPVLTSYYKSRNFRNRPFNRYNVYTSPDEAILCPDSKQSMYCQLLCGLVQRHEVLRVGAVFASAFLRAIKFLEDYWKELCSDIRTGQVSDWITDLSCRSAVSLILGKPRPDMADLIEKECSRESWEGIIKKLWPKTKYIEVIVTGSMAQYIPTLEFYSGGLPLISTMYASSECYFGINLNPLSKPPDVSYTLLPNMAYFEFLPVDKNHDEMVQNCNGALSPNCKKVEDDEKVEICEVVDLVDVKVGSYYELVVTTFTGEYVSTLTS